MADDRGALDLRLGGGGVGGAVVDDEHVEAGREPADVAHDATDHPSSL